MNTKNESDAKQEPEDFRHNAGIYNGRAIKLPVRWDRQQDRADFDDCFGDDLRSADDESPLDFLQEKLPSAYEEFNEVLDNALNHYLGQTTFALTGGVAVLSTEEKIEWLLELVATRSASAPYRARFEDALAECLFIDRKRRRVLRGLLRSTEEPWLYPLCALADGLVSRAMDFEESLVCAHCGYQQPLVFH